LCNFDQILALCGLPYLVSVTFFVTLAPQLILVCAPRAPTDTQIISPLPFLTTPDPFHTQLLRVLDSI